MNIEIANRLVCLRKAHHLSQEELAAKIGISRQAVSKWERAEASPDTDNLILLAKLYEISLDELLKTDEPIELKEQVTGEQMDADKEMDCQNRNLRRIFMRFPYPMFITIIFFVAGWISGSWKWTWLLFFTIPIYYWTVNMIFQLKE